MAKKRAINPVEGQVTFAEIFFAKVEELKKPLKRTARANAILDCIDRTNYSNMKLGAIGAYGETGFRFDFGKAYGARTNRHGVEVERKTYDEVVTEAAESVAKAMAAADRACEVCEYADYCEWKGKLYETLSPPDMANDREKLERRMRVIVNCRGEKTMKCPTAITIHYPRKADWDY